MFSRSSIAFSIERQVCLNLSYEVKWYVSVLEPIKSGLIKKRINCKFIVVGMQTN